MVITCFNYFNVLLIYIGNEKIFVVQSNNNWLTGFIFFFYTDPAACDSKKIDLISLPLKKIFHHQ